MTLVLPVNCKIHVSGITYRGGAELDEKTVHALTENQKSAIKKAEDDLNGKIEVKQPEIIKEKKVSKKIKSNKEA